VCDLCAEMLEERERLRKLLCDTVSMLCRNSLPHQRGIRIQGVIGITVDEEEVFLVHINNTVTSRPDTLPQETQYSAHVKSERGCTVKQEPRYQSTLMMPYDGAMNTAAASSDHISSTVVTESVDVNTGYMMDDDSWGEMGGGGDEESYSDLAFPLMDVMADIGDYKPRPATQRRGRTKLSVCRTLCFCRHTLAQLLLRWPLETNRNSVSVSVTAPKLAIFLLSVTAVIVKLGFSLLSVTAETTTRFRREPKLSHSCAANVCI